MGFKLIAVMCLLSAAAALNYDYKKPTLKLNVSSKSNGYSIGALQLQSRPGSSGRNVNSARPTTFGHALSVSSGSFGSSSQATESRNEAFKAPVVEEHYPPAKYQFSYAVNNLANGDIKSHSESRDGDQVRGSYSVIDADGYKRIVTYTVDGNSGFNAVVTREPYALNSVNKLIAAPAVLKLQEVESTSANAQQLQQLQQPQQFEVQQSQSQPQQFQSPSLQTQPQVQQSQPQPLQQQQQFQSPPLQTQALPLQSQLQPLQPQQFQSQPFQQQQFQSPPQAQQSQPQPLQQQQFQSQPFQQQQFQTSPLQPQSQSQPQQAQKETRPVLPIQPRDSYASAPAQHIEGPYA